jgi:carbon monoxide dehydrogenase subunit G
MSQRRLTSITLLIGLAGVLGLWAIAPAPARAADNGGGWFWRTAAVTGSGTAATEVRTVAPFQAIATTGAINLTIRQATREAVDVRADDNLLPALETVVEADGGTPTLKVRWKRGVDARPRTETTVTIDVVSLHAISAAGSGRITVEPLTTSALKLSLSGSGDARLNGLQVGELAVSVAGSGDVRAAGTAERVRLSIAGSGDLNFADLRADEVTVSIAGSGDAAVNAQKTLKVSIAGSGDVSYSGEPSVTSSIAGSGRVGKR